MRNRAPCIRPSFMITKQHSINPSSLIVISTCQTLYLIAYQAAPLFPWALETIHDGGDPVQGCYSREAVLISKSVYKAPDCSKGLPLIMTSSQSQQQQDNYALAILTRAALQTPTPSPVHYEPSSASLLQTSDLVSMPSALAANANSHSYNNQLFTQESNVAQMQTFMPHTLSQSSPSMNILAYASSRDTQHQYLANNYHDVNPQMPMPYSRDIGILSAETYDDGRLTMASQHSRAPRSKQGTSPVIPFGLTETQESTKIRRTKAGSSDGEKGTKRKKVQRESHNDEDEEAKKRARGRPRVDTVKDETAADVSLIFWLRHTLLLS